MTLQGAVLLAKDVAFGYTALELLIGLVFLVVVALIVYKLIVLLK